MNFFNKRTLITILSIFGILIMFYVLTAKQSKKEKPLIITESSSLRELSIDDKIKEAELIVIGEVKTTLPTKWKGNNEKDIKNATPQEIFDAEGLFTDSIISVNEILKGDYKDPLIRVRSYIGETDQVHWINSSQPSFNKGQVYLLFLEKDIGPTSKVAPGDYVSVNSNTAIYEIVGDKAISADDEWILEELIAYIQNSLAQPIPAEPAVTEIPMETSLPTETVSPTP
jgi:hypothetical protein